MRPVRYCRSLASKWARALVCVWGGTGPAAPGTAQPRHLAGSRGEATGRRPPAPGPAGPDTAHRPPGRSSPFGVVDGQGCGRTGTIIVTFLSCSCHRCRQICSSRGLAHVLHVSLNVATGGNATAEEAWLGHERPGPRAARRKGSAAWHVLAPPPMLVANYTTTTSASSENASGPPQTHGTTFCLRILRFPGTLTLNVCVSPNSHVGS